MDASRLRSAQREDEPLIETRTIAARDLVRTDLHIVGTLNDTQTAQLLTEIHLIRFVFLTVLSDEDCDCAQKMRQWPRDRAQWRSTAGRFRGGGMNLNGPESGQQVASSAGRAT